MRIGVSFDLGDIIFVYFLEGVFSLQKHWHGLSQLTLGLVLYSFYLYCLHVCVLSLCQHLLLHYIGLFLLLGQSYQELFSFNALLLQFGLQLSHLYLQFCHYVVSRVEFIESL